jgi:hypothetical protein
MRTTFDHNSLDWGPHFQTPPDVCEYMASFVRSKFFLRSTSPTILEPTPGQGNLVSALEKYGRVTAPRHFGKMKDQKFDYVVMNPPFSPAQRGYDILFRCMNMTNNIIALMPWVTLTNSEPRTKDILQWGLKSVTHLPRRIFSGARVQACILEMDKGWRDPIIFKFYQDGNS